MESLWRIESGKINGNISLEAFILNDEIAHKEWDVIVVGAGISGLLTAYLLTERGKKVLVLEAKNIASGQTERTTAKITSQHGLIYSKLIKSVGINKARMYANANEDAIREYQRIIKTNEIECGFEKTTAYLYSVNSDKELKEEEKSAKLAGIDAFITKDTELPFNVSGALGFRNQAQFQPLEFIKHIVPKLNIVENAKVIDIKGHKVFVKKSLSEEESHKKWHHKDRADVVLKAKKIVVATHYPLHKYKGLYFMRQHQERSYVLALSRCGKINNLYYGIDKDGLSFRMSGDYLLLGGSGHRTGENGTKMAYEMLRAKANEYYPYCREKARWSAQDCMPHDGIPFIGKYCIFTPNMYVATGFQKWGMSTAMVAAMLIRDDILGIKNPYRRVFSPFRINIKAGIKAFLVDMAKSMKGLAKGLLHRPKETSDVVDNGKGEIVTERGKVYACYKEDNGRIHMISHRCSHMGCELNWNADEKSWDCPCHGSRYDIYGNVLDNPAKEDVVHHF